MKESVSYGLMCVHTRNHAHCCSVVQNQSHLFNSKLYIADIIHHDNAQPLVKLPSSSFRHLYMIMGCIDSRNAVV
jgi:hypothetical protein